MTRFLLALVAVVFAVFPWGVRVWAVEAAKTESAKKVRNGSPADVSEDDKSLPKQGFRQEGIATWYGKSLHGHETTSGEIYDMNGMTAAHRTLPFNTFVKVTNPANGTEVIVRINDRGPFAKDRIIDLSYAAAKKLGIMENRPFPVQLEVLGYKKSSEGEDLSYTPVDCDAGEFFIHLGFFKEYETVRRLTDELKANSEFAGIKKLRRKKVTHYRVFAGTYHSLRAAEEARARFIEKGFGNSLVVAQF